MELKQKDAVEEMQRISLLIVPYGIETAKAAPRATTVSTF